MMRPPRLPALAIGALVLAAGCAMPPLRGPAAAPSVPPTRTALAAAIEVEGSRGDLSRAAREQAIAKLEAQGRADVLREQLAAMSAATGGDRPVELFQGNRTALLIDGPSAFDARFAALEKAARSIYIETYILEDEGLAQRLADLLLRKRAAGVAVHVIFDAVGSIGTDQAYFDRLSAGGVQVCRFNPLNPLERPGHYRDINHRDHRKITVVDGREGFTGGINVSQVYSSGSFPGGRSRSAEEGWRDTDIAVAGPGAWRLEALVRETWLAQRCEGALAEPSPRPPAQGDKVVRVVASGPDSAPGEMVRALLAAIDRSRHSVHLTMAYFAPGEEVIEALVRAARRGVDVQLILPSVSDFAPVLHAGRSWYARLLEGGVHIAELRDAVLHAKTAVIDGVWSTVGSSNLDWRSIVANNEVDVIVLGEDFGQAMERQFERDLAQSRRIDPAAWAERPVTQRLKEWLARLAERWL